MNLIVIGNGFDLHHNLPTSYRHFREWLDTNHHEALTSIEAAFPVNREVLWSNFEGCIGDYAVKDPELIFKMPPQERVRIEDLYRSIPNLFYEWVQDLEKHIQAAQDRGGLVPISYIRDLISPDDACLDFNYTTTVERLYAPSNVFHIHFPAGSGVIIVGHGREVGPELPTADPTVIEHDLESPDTPAERINDDPSVDWEENKQKMRANSAVNCLNKNPDRNIRLWREYFNRYKDAEKIAILGWSLGREDRRYMDELLRGSRSPVYVAVRGNGLEQNFIDYENEHPDLMDGRRFVPIPWENLGEL